METAPYINVTGTVTTFDAEDHTFTMTPNQYIVLSHCTLPFPIHARFANWESKKRWGPEGPKVTVGSTVTFGGLLERIVRERTIDRRLEFADIEVASIAYFGTRANLTISPTRMSFKKLAMTHTFNSLTTLILRIGKQSLWTPKTMELGHPSKTFHINRSIDILYFQNPSEEKTR